MTNLTNKDFVEAWYASIDSKDFDTVKKLMDSKHTFKNPLTPRVLGADQHIGMLKTITGALTGHHHPDHVVSEKDWVTVYGHWSGKHTGEFNGIPATGRDVTFTLMDMFHIVNDKVMEEFVEMNPEIIVEQISSGKSQPRRELRI